MRQMIISTEPWIGERPSDWNENKIKYVAPIHNERAESNDGYIGLENIEGWTGRLIPSDSVAVGESVSFKENDVLFGKLRPYLAKSLLVKKDGCGSTELLVMRPEKIFPGYLAYITRSTSFVDRVDVSTYGAKMPRANANFIGNLRIPIPSHNEQQAIVDFLDSKCAAIDEAIERHQKAIEKLEEYQKAITFHFVTKGIDEADLRQSGVTWLGSIPKKWNVQRVVSLFKEINERGNSGLPILTLSINTGISDRELEEGESERTFVRSEDKSKYKRVLPGDIAYNMMRAWQGAFGAARVEGMVSPAYITARPIVDMDTRYFEYLMRTDVAAEEFKKYSRGITDFRLRLYWSEFKNIKVCVPPIEEQRAIADKLDQIYRTIDETKKCINTIIDKLREYRKSLIYHAVTGKIDCRGADAS